MPLTSVWSVVMGMMPVTVEPCAGEVIQPLRVVASGFTATVTSDEALSAPSEAESRNT